MKLKLLVIIMLLLASCNTANKPMTDEQKAAVKEEATVVVQQAIDALKTSNTEQWFNSMENSPDATFISFGDLYTYDQMKEMAAQYLPQIKKQTFVTKYEKYIIVDPDCFVYIWQGDNGMYMTSGDSTILKDYVLSYTFRKNKDGWKLVAGHESQKAPIPSIDTAKTE